MSNVILSRTFLRTYFDVGPLARFHRTFRAAGAWQSDETTLSGSDVPVAWPSDRQASLWLLGVARFQQGQNQLTLKTEEC